MVHLACLVGLLLRRKSGLFSGERMSIWFEGCWPLIFGLVLLVLECEFEF